jgi:hypothetical protein
MIEIDVQVPSKIKTEELIHLIEQIGTQHDLVCSLKGTLRSYPGCVHWHFKKEKKTGTLEITWWEKERRLWFKVGDHRSAAWIEETMPHLKKQMETAFFKK